MIKPLKRNPKYPDNLVLNDKLIAAGRAAVQENKVQFKPDPKASQKAMLYDNHTIILQVAETHESIRLTCTEADRASSTDDVWLFSKQNREMQPSTPTTA